MVPVRGKLFTAERDHLAIIEAAAKDRGTELVAVNPEAIAEVTADDLDGFRYTEHPDNVALALAVCADLGVPRRVALLGMQHATPDPGALTVHRVTFFGRTLVFFNAFAANDPVSTQKLWRLAVDATPEVRTRIAILNCRADRPRSLAAARRGDRHLGSAGSHRTHGQRHVLFAREAAKQGYDAARLLFVEGLGVEEIFERIVALVGKSALLVGMGNIGGQGLELARYFRNRSEPELEDDDEPRESIPPSRGESAS